SMDALPGLELSNIKFCIHSIFPMLFERQPPHNSSVVGGTSSNFFWYENGH
ncbi:MAG: hypothetical protein ACI9HY_004059, partial [Planctomycetaceae bacterium]